MDKYEVLKEIGQGTFGSVLKAQHKTTGEFVAVKKMKQKYYSWEECIKLPEVAALRKFNSHPNIVKLKEVVREQNILYFVFEFLDGDMLGRMQHFKKQNGVGLPHHMVKSYVHQLLQSLQFLHRCGYFHRDLKPENILLKHGEGNQNGGGRPDIIKLADFGLVKEIRARPPFTDYVSTRWYRSPEILLQDRAYSSPCDMWAVGCMISEFYTSRPLFPGSNEVDQMFRIVTVLGTPSEASWPEGYQMARKIQYKFPTSAPTPLEKVLGPHVPAEAIDLMKKLLVFDPRKRLTAMQALNHPFFQGSLEENALIQPSTSSKFGGMAGSMPGKAPSAPSPHYSKQVEWKQEAAVNQIQNPQAFAKPSSAEGTSRLPPVSMPQATNKATGGTTAGTTSTFSSNVANNQGSVPKVSAGSGLTKLPSSLVGGAYGSNNTNVSNRAKPLLSAGRSGNMIGATTSGTNTGGNSPVQQSALGTGNSPNNGINRRRESNATKAFDFSAWQRVKDNSSASNANTSSRPVGPVSGAERGGNSPPPLAPTASLTNGGTRGAGGSASRERPPIVPGISGVTSSSSAAYSSGLNLPPSGGRTTGGAGAGGSKATSVGANFHIAPLTSSPQGLPSATSGMAKRKSPSPTQHQANKDIVDQALEELLGSSPSWNPSKFGGSSGSNASGKYGSGGAAGKFAGSGSSRRGGGESPLAELMRSSTFKSSSNENVVGDMGGGSGLRDRSNVPRRASGGVVVGPGQPLAPISPSVSTILERKKNVGATSGNFQHSGSFGTKLNF